MLGAVDLLLVHPCVDYKSVGGLSTCYWSIHVWIIRVLGAVDLLLVHPCVDYKNVGCCRLATGPSMCGL